MKLTSRLCIPLLILPLVFCCLSSCHHENDDTTIVGRWRVVSYVTDDGLSPTIENELDMIFYSTGIGEAQIDGETLYMFDYTIKSGMLHRIITHSSTDVIVADEPYTFSNGGQTLTVYSPSDSATIVMEKVTSDVAHRIDVPSSDK